MPKYRLKENVDYNKLDKYKDRFTFRDSSGYFLYNSISNPIKRLRIYEHNRQVKFVNGEFPAATKLIKDLINDDLIEEV